MMRLAGHSAESQSTLIQATRSLVANQVKLAGGACAVVASSLLLHFFNAKPTRALWWMGKNSSRVALIFNLIPSVHF